MKKFLILLMLVGLLMPERVWAAKAVFSVPLPSCGCFIFPGSNQDRINDEAQTPANETARCDLYLTIRVDGFQTPIGVKIIEKLIGHPNKKGKVVAEFLQDEAERTYSVRELGVSDLVEIVLDTPLPATDPSVFLTITNLAGDLGPPGPCYEGLPIRIHGIRKK